MKRLVLIPLSALALTLATLWHVSTPLTWGFETSVYGYPVAWLFSFAGVGGGGPFVNWQVDASGLVVDYLFWLEICAAGILSAILLQSARVVASGFELPTSS